MARLKKTRYVLALDQGGSKCEGLLVREDGVVLKGCRAQRPGFSGRSLETVLAAARQLLPAPPPGVLHIALLNCDYEMAKALVRETGAAKAHVIDEVDGLLALCGEDCGVAVVAGTGARVLAKTRNGRFLSLDGVGPILGDMGSGYSIGRLALRAAVKAVWHPRHHTRLRDRIFDVCKRWSRGNPARARPPLRVRGRCRAIVHSMAAQVSCNIHATSDRPLHDLVQFSLSPCDRSVVAALSRIVNEEAEAGDGVALGILRRAAADISENVRDLVDRLEMRREPFLLVGSGSVAMHSEIYWRHFRRQVRKFASNARVRRLPYPPVAGIALFALRQIGARDPAGVCRRRLFQSLKTCRWRNARI